MQTMPALFPGNSKFFSKIRNREAGLSEQKLTGIGEESVCENELGSKESPARY
jgi:hypothetical protein